MSSAGHRHRQASPLLHDRTGTSPLPRGTPLPSRLAEYWSSLTASAQGEAQSAMTVNSARASARIAAGCAFEVRCNTFPGSSRVAWLVA